MKRTPVLQPLHLPRLSDKTAAQFVAALRELLSAIEDHYARQAYRYRRRQRERHRPPSTHPDLPF
jgi:tRNA G26 N,N-dimethylase Trm1